jgi:hypothetical protein
VCGRRSISKEPRYPVGQILVPNAQRGCGGGITKAACRLIDLVVVFVFCKLSGRFLLAKTWWIGCRTISLPVNFYSLLVKSANNISETMTLSSNSHCNFSS